MGNTEKFDSMASNYDTTERVSIAYLSSQAINQALNNGNSSKYKTALDFGCGTGLVGLDLINNFEEILFMDTSINMLNVVDEKINLLGLSNAKTIHLDLEANENLDLNIAVDCIFMCQVLLHIENYIPVLDKLKNMLAPNGVIFIVDFDKNFNISSDLVHNGFDQEKLKAEFKSLGFTKINSSNFHSGEKIFMNQDATMFLLRAEL